MPSDLIYREDAKDYARHAMAKGLNVLEYLDEVPAADFRPVVHAKWSVVYDDFMKSHYDTCSCCGKEYFGANGFNFCPNCGAYMRGDQDV